MVLNTRMSKETLKKTFKDPCLFSKIHLGWPLHDYQKNIMRDESRFIAIIMSRQGGKTTVVCGKSGHKAFTKKNQEILVVAPAERQSKRFYNAIRSRIRQNPYLSSMLIADTKEEMRLSNGSTICNVPAGDDGENIRGYALDLLIMDEAAFISDEVYATVLPFLSSTRGQLILLSSGPKKPCMFSKVILGEDEDSPIRFSVHSYDWELCMASIREDTGFPQLSHDDIMLYKSLHTEAEFRREYCCECVFGEDKFFLREIIEASIIDEPPITSPELSKIYFMGVDFGKLHDYTVAIVIEVSMVRVEGKPSINVKVVYKWSIKGVDYQDQLPRIARIAKDYNVRMTFADQTGCGEPILERMVGMMPTTGIKFSIQSKNDMYRNLQFLFRNGLIQIPTAFKSLTTQLMDLDAIETKVTDCLRIEKPNGKFDDEADALALACSSVRPRHLTSKVSIRTTAKAKKVVGQEVGGKGKGNGRNRYGVTRRRKTAVPMAGVGKRKKTTSLSDFLKR